MNTDPIADFLTRIRNANSAGLRTVVIEFDSYETAVAAYNSHSYKTAMGSLNGTLKREFKIIRNAV